jgi:hypothetical protein
VTGLWFSLGILVSSTNKTDCHYITEILLKVVLKTRPNQHHFHGNSIFLKKKKEKRKVLKNVTQRHVARLNKVKKIYFVKLLLVLSKLIDTDSGEPLFFKFSF